jgi:hypothetical protein
MTKGRRIIARFHPQAWVDDYAVEVDPEGPLEWDVTQDILRMGKAKAMDIQDERESSDALQDVPTAPEWVRTWAGPFWVEVEESVREYYGA